MSVQYVFFHDNQRLFDVVYQFDDESGKEQFLSAIRLALGSEVISLRSFSRSQPFSVSDFRARLHTMGIAATLIERACAACPPDVTVKVSDSKVTREVAATPVAPRAPKHSGERPRTNTPPSRPFVPTLEPLTTPLSREVFQIWVGHELLCGAPLHLGGIGRFNTVVRALTDNTARTVIGQACRAGTKGVPYNRDLISAWVAERSYIELGPVRERLGYRDPLSSEAAATLRAEWEQEKQRMAAIERGRQERQAAQAGRSDVSQVSASLKYRSRAEAARKGRQPLNHPAFTEEDQRLEVICRQIDRRIDHLAGTLAPSVDVTRINNEELSSLHAVADSPYYLRLMLRMEDGTCKNICLSESVRDLTLPDTYIAGVGSPLRHLIHKNTRHQSLSGATGQPSRVFIRLRRQLGITDRNIDQIQDNLPFTDIEQPESAHDLDAFAQLGQEYLLAQLDREASAKARSILSTISERQDDLMSAPGDQLLVVNGAPGSGKTAIAHSRIPLLLHKERNATLRLREERIAIFVPNRFLQSYLKHLLPRYGLHSVMHMTFEDWALRIINGTNGRRVGRVVDRTAEVIFSRKATRQEKNLAWKTAKLRGERVMIDLLRQLVSEVFLSWLHSQSMTITSDLLGPHGFRLPDVVLKFETLSPVIEEFREGGLTRAEMTARLAREAAQQAAVTVESAWHEAIDQAAAEWAAGEHPERAGAITNMKALPLLPLDLTEQVAAFLSALTPWPNAWEAYLDLMGRRRELSSVVKRLYPTGTRVVVAALYRAPMVAKSKGETSPTPPPDITELPLVLALKILLEGARPNDAQLGDLLPGGLFDYLVIDEGQDLSPLQYALLARYVRPGQAAVFGDLRQSIHAYRGIDSWDHVLETLGRGGESVEHLHQTFRSSQEITERANMILTATKSRQPLAEAVPRPSSPVHFVRYGAPPHLVPLLAHEIRRLQAAGAQNIGIISRSPEEARKLAARIKERQAFPIDSSTSEFDQYEGGIAVVPISVAKGLEFDAAVIIDADGENYQASTPYDGPLLYTSVTRALHHLTLFAAKDFTPLLGHVPLPNVGVCPVSGLQLSADGILKVPAFAGGRVRQMGQERGPGANHTNMVRTADGRFDSTSCYEGDGSQENPWYDR